MAGFRGMPAEPTASVAVARLVLDGLERSGGDGRELARQSGLPACMPAGHSAHVPTECLSRLWRLALAGSDDPCLGVKVAGQWRFGRLHLMDYLFTAAPMLAEAIAELASHSALLNTAANEIRLAGDTVPVAGQVGPQPGIFPQLADLGRRDETGPQHAPLGQLRQPDRIELRRSHPAAGSARTASPRSPCP